MNQSAKKSRDTATLTLGQHWVRCGYLMISKEVDTHYKDGLNGYIFSIVLILTLIVCLSRSLAIEKAYVHDVYEQISANFSDSRYRAWPRVKQFLMDLEPGAFVCDVGEYSVNPNWQKGG